MITRRVFVLAFAALTAVIADAILSPRADAASFDCATAARPIEALICSDPKLSKLDEEMTQAYAAKIATLSPAGRQILKQSQRSWLRMVDGACELEPACVAEKYQHRSDELRTPWQVGPFQLVFVGRYEAFRIKGDDPDIEGQLVYHEVEYPQIDAPRNPDTERWNKLIADGVQGNIDEPYIEAAPDIADISVGATINAASPELISAELGAWYFVHGMPHGRYYSEQWNILLKTGSSIGPVDLFDQATPWRDALLRHCLPELIERNHELDLDAEDLKDVIDNARMWTITPETLEIAFDFNEIIGYGRGVDSIVIPWRDLKAYLRPALPLALELD